MRDLRNSAIRGGGRDGQLGEYKVASHCGDLEFRDGEKKDQVCEKRTGHLRGATTFPAEELEKGTLTQDKGKERQMYSIPDIHPVKGG